MKKISIILLVPIVLTVLVISCQKKSQGVLLTADGSTNPAMIEFKEELNGDLNSMSNSDGVKALGVMANSLLGTTLSTGRYSSVSKTKQLNDFIDYKVLSKYPNAKRKLSQNKYVQIRKNVFTTVDRFISFVESNARKNRVKTDSTNILAINFNDAQGVYRYNVKTKQFDQVSSNSNGILMIFPSDTNNLSNYDGELYVSKLTSQKVIFEGQNLELPSNFSMELKVKSKKVAGFSFDVVYGNDYIPVKSLKLNIFLTPMDYHLSMNYSPSLVNITTSLTNIETAKQILSANINLETYNNNKLNNANGFVQLANLKADFKVTPNAGSLNNINSSNFDNQVKVDIYTYPQNKYVGKLAMDDDDTWLIETTTGPMILGDFISNLLTK